MITVQSENRGDLIIHVKWRKWTIQTIMNSLCVALLGTVAWIYTFRAAPSGGSEGAGQFYAGCLFLMALPSMLLILHLLTIAGKPAMTVSGQKFSDRTRMFRKVKNVPLTCVTAIAVVYRGRPFTGISREYRVQYDDKDTGKSGEFFIADYLVSRGDLQLVMSQIRYSSGIQQPEL